MKIYLNVGQYLFSTIENCREYSNKSNKNLFNFGEIFRTKASLSNIGLMLIACLKKDLTHIKQFFWIYLSKLFYTI